MNPKSPMAEHIDRYIREVHDLLVIIVSDSEGVHIFNACHESAQDKLEKIIQTSTMLISTIGQCEGNFQKIGKKKSLSALSYYYDEYLIHFRKSNHYNVTLFMRPRASGLLAEDISAELVQAFGFLSGILSKRE